MKTKLLLVTVLTLNSSQLLADGWFGDCPRSPFDRDSITIYCSDSVSDQKRQRANEQRLQERLENQEKFDAGITTDHIMKVNHFIQAKLAEFKKDISPLEQLVSNNPSAQNYLHVGNQISDLLKPFPINSSKYNIDGNIFSSQPLNPTDYSIENIIKFSHHSEIVNLKKNYKNTLYSTVIKYWQVAAQMGNGEAAYQIYKNRYLYSDFNEQAKTYLKIAADLGYFEAQKEIGMQAYGDKKYEDAKKYLQAALENPETPQKDKGEIKSTLSKSKFFNFFN